MDSESVIFTVGKPHASSAKIAALYFDIFARKLGAVLGRRAAVGIIADHLIDDRIIVACGGEAVAGIAGLKYDGIGIFSPDRQSFLNHYSRLTGRLRAGVLYERFGYRIVSTTRRWMFRLAGFSSADLMLRRLP